MASIAERRELKVSRIPAKGGQMMSSDPESFSLPLYVANAVVLPIFFSAVYYLVLQWRDKIRNSTPLNLSQISALLVFFASFIYLLTFIIPPSDDEEEETIDEDLDNQVMLKASTAASKYKLIMDNEWLWSESDESVEKGKTPESKLGDCGRAAAICRQALQRTNYEKILSEMPVGYVQTPVGIAGPLLLDGAQYLTKLLFFR